MVGAVQLSKVMKAQETADADNFVQKKKIGASTHQVSQNLWREINKLCLRSGLFFKTDDTLLWGINHTCLSSHWI